MCNPKLTSSFHIAVVISNHLLAPQATCDESLSRLVDIVVDNSCMLLQAMHICCVESPAMFYAFDNVLFSSCVGVLLPLLVADLYHALTTDDRAIVHFLPQTLQTLQRLLPVLLRRIPRLLKLVSQQRESDHRETMAFEEFFGDASPILSRRLRARWSAIHGSRNVTQPPQPKKSAIAGFDLMLFNS